MNLEPRTIVALRAAAALVFTSLVTVPSAVTAQTADVAGTWALRVTTDQGVTTPSFVLQQDGETLTGRYSSETLGSADIRGTVRGSSVTINLTGSIQGQSVPVVYRGTLGDDGRLTGTIDLGGGAITGTFTATRSGTRP